MNGTKALVAAAVAAKLATALCVAGAAARSSPAEDARELERRMAEVSPRFKEPSGDSA